LGGAVVVGEGLPVLVRDKDVEDLALVVVASLQSSRTGSNDNDISPQ